MYVKTLVYNMTSNPTFMNIADYSSAMSAVRMHLYYLQRFTMNYYSSYTNDMYTYMQLFVHNDS